MTIKTQSVVEILTQSQDTDKLIAGARVLLSDSSVNYLLNRMWLEYARLEADLLRSTREDRKEAAKEVLDRRLALDDFLGDLESMSEAQMSDEREDNQSEETE